MQKHQFTKQLLKNIPIIFYWDKIAYNIILVSGTQYSDSIFVYIKK